MSMLITLPSPPSEIYGPVLLVGGPMHGYRVPRESRDAFWITYPIYSEPRVLHAIYAPTNRAVREFVRDVPIYEYLGSSTGA